jgi:hypothetical protein
MEGLGKLRNNSMTSRIEPETFRLVAQNLNMKENLIIKEIFRILGTENKQTSKINTFTILNIYVSLLLVLIRVTFHPKLYS